MRMCIKFCFVARVLEKLRLCEEFFPAFQTVITQLQEILGKINNFLIVLILLCDSVMKSLY